MGTMTKSVLTVVLTVVLLSHVSYGSIININFNGALSGTYGTGTGQLLAPAPYTGSTWNSSGTGGNSFTLNNLTDSDGVSTIVDLSLSGARTATSTPATNSYMDVLSTFRFDNSTSGPTVITLSDLTAGVLYDVHFILQGNGNEGGTVTMTSGSTLIPTPAVSLGDFGRTAGQGGPATSYIEGRNYASQSFISDGTDATFDLTGNVSTPGLMTIAGIQIVEIPEPASLVLLGGMGALLIARRNRR